MNAIADDRPDAVTAHLAGRVSNNPMVIVEHHPEPAIGQDLVHNTFDCKQFFFRHKPIVRVRRDAPERASRG